MAETPVTPLARRICEKVFQDGNITVAQMQAAFARQSYRADLKAKYDCTAIHIEMARGYIKEFIRRKLWRAICHDWIPESRLLTYYNAFGCESAKDWIWTNNEDSLEIVLSGCSPAQIIRQVSGNSLYCKTDKYFKYNGVLKSFNSVSDNICGASMVESIMAAGKEGAFLRGLNQQG